MTTSDGSVDVEALLRRTYAEVAARTAVDAPSEARPVRFAPAGGESPGAWRRLLAAAAVLAVVAGGLVLLANRGAEQSAGRDGATRVLPGWVPLTDVEEANRSFVLVELSSDADRDRIVYGVEGASIGVELDRTRSVLGDGETTTVRGGSARRTDSTLSWIGPDDALLEVFWSGAVDDESVEMFAGSIAYVDEEVWAEFAGTGGFRASDGEPLATIRIDADESFDVDIVGDLHGGLWLEVSGGGYSIAHASCAASWNFEVSDMDERVAAYIILSTGDFSAATVDVPDGVRRIELTSLLPLLDVSIGGVVFEDRSSNEGLPDVRCEGAS